MIDQDDTKRMLEEWRTAKLMAIGYFVVAPIVMLVFAAVVWLIAKVQP